MSEESSQSQDLEVKEASPQKFQSFTGFPISSDTSDTRDKDTLIDEMQAKFGELLKVNEDLCAARNEIEVLKESLSHKEKECDEKLQVYKDQIAQFEETVKEDQEVIADQKNQIEDLTEDNKNLKATVAQLKARIASMEQNSDNEVQHKVDTQTGQLRATVEDKDRQIRNLKQQLEALQTVHVSSNESVEQQRIENDRLQSHIERQTKEIDRHKEEKSKMNGRLQKQKETIESLEQRNRELEVELTAQRSEVKHMKERELLSKEKLGKKDADCFVAREELQRALAISPGFKDVDELLDFMMKQAKEVAALKQERKKERASLKKCLKTIKRYELALQEADKKVEEADLRARSFQEEMRAKSRVADRISRENEHIKRRLRVLPVFDKANSMLNQRLARIRESVRGEEDITSIRTLTAVAIMINRWRTLTGTEEKYTDDSRNWWWMNPEKSYEVTTEQIAERITSLNQELVRSQDEIKLLQESVRSEQRKVKAANAETATAKKEIDVKAAQIQQLEIQIQDLQAELETKIDPEEHNKALAEFKVIKDKYKKVKQKARENDLEMTNLQMDLSQTKQKLNQQITLTRQKERSVKDLQFELYQAQEGISYWRQGSTSKTKDMLALERGLVTQQRATAAVRMQNDVMAIENRRLGTQMNTYKRKLDTLEQQQT